MANKVQFPIRAKLMLLMTCLVLTAISAYVAMAISLFKDDKTSLIYELNASNVKTLAAQTEATLLKIADKIRLLTQGHRDVEWTKTVLEAEPDLIAYTLYESTDDPNAWRPIVSIRNNDYLKLYGLNASEIETIRSQIHIPFAKVLAKRSWVTNSTLSNGAPILTLAIALEIKDGAMVGREHVALADVRLDRMLKLVSGRGIASVYIIDADGTIVAHPEPSLITGRVSMGEVPIVREALESSAGFQVKPFEWKGARWLGAYAPVSVGGLTVISQIEESQAFRSARKLIEKTILFGAIVITLALLISGWLAGTMTRPLEKLLLATDKLARWEFGESIHVKTRDEIARLARAFNTMASDLQNQRNQIEAHQSELERKVKERTLALEVQKKQLAETQENLLRTTRLASLGELAGVAAHEVLNPTNNMNIRIERIADELKRAEKEDLKLANEILTAWKQKYDQGGWKALEADLNRPAEGSGKTLVQEDLENLTGIVQDAMKRHATREEDIRFLSHEITRITRIINNMRSLSRVGAERKPLDVHSPIEDTALSLMDQLEKRKISLVKDFGAEERRLYTVIAHQDELVQVFSNLLRNALQAIDSAKRRAGVVRITTRRQENRIEIRIIDNGTGIKKEHLPRLFEPNFTTKSAEEGTGLGLSISRRLIRAFGGDIEVEATTAGEGTTFLIWLPAAS